MKTNCAYTLPDGTVITLAHVLAIRPIDNMNESCEVIFISGWSMFIKPKDRLALVKALEAFCATETSTADTSIKVKL